MGTLMHKREYSGSTTPGDTSIWQVGSFLLHITIEMLSKQLLALPQGGSYYIFHANRIIPKHALWLTGSTDGYRRTG